MSGVVDTTELREQVERAQPRAGKTVKQAVSEQLPQIARALPKATGMTPERFTRLVLTEISRNPKLQECTVESFLGAMMYAAQLGVEPGPLGHAYLVPFGREVTFILGYKGIIALARRSGDITGIEARAVRQNDFFEWEYGLEDKLVHKPVLDEPGPSTSYYGIAKFADGGHYFLVMSRNEIEKRRARSRAKDAGPWKSDYEAMALKTVIRAMQPYLPLTAEAATAIEVDERVTATFDPDATEMLTITEQPYEDAPEVVAETPDEPGVQEAEVVAVVDADDASASETESVAMRPAEGRATVILPEPEGRVDYPGLPYAPETEGELLEVDVNDEVLDVPDIAEVDVGDPVLDSYPKMTAGELAQECVNRGLSNAGAKQALIKRLRDDDAKPF